MTYTVVENFPFEEIRAEGGNLFFSAADAHAAGFDVDQIWSVVECDEYEDDDEGDLELRTSVWVYGPSHHYVNVLGFVATHERHDGDTYFEERWSV
jgi:hypothetical protein